MAIGGLLSALIPFGQQLGETISQKIGEQIGAILPTASEQTSKTENINEKTSNVAISVIPSKTETPYVELVGYTEEPSSSIFIEEVIEENNKYIGEQIGAILPTASKQTSKTENSTEKTIEKEEAVTTTEPSSSIFIEEVIVESNNFNETPQDPAVFIEIVEDKAQTVDLTSEEEQPVQKEETNKTEASSTFYSNVGGERTRIKPDKKREVPIKEQKPHTSHAPRKDSTHNTSHSSNNKKPNKHKLKSIETIKIPDHVMKMFTRKN